MLVAVHSLNELNRKCQFMISALIQLPESGLVILLGPFLAGPFGFAKACLTTFLGG